LQDQLDSLPYLCRFQYEKTSNYITTLLEPILQVLFLIPLMIDSHL
jgi:exportin-7